MSRAAVNLLLVAWLIVTWGAFVLRVDRFPLTWAPMYSDYQPIEVQSHRIVDRERMARGLLVTHRDGSTSYVGTDELNIPKVHMYRLYYQRAFGQRAVKYRYGNRSLGAFNRWVRGLGPDEPNLESDNTYRVFESLNRTLGYEPDDPRFIVRIQATVDRVYRRLDDLETTWQKTLDADLHWTGERDPS